MDNACVVKDRKIVQMIGVGLPGLAIGGRAPVWLIGAPKRISGQRPRTWAGLHWRHRQRARLVRRRARRRVQRERGLELREAEGRESIADQQQGQEPQAMSEQARSEQPVAAQQRTTQTGHADSFQKPYGASITLV